VGFIARVHGGIPKAAYQKYGAGNQKCRIMEGNMKRYGKDEIKKAFETGEHLKVEGFASTVSVKLENTDYNQDIIDSGKEYGELTCLPYNKDGQIIGGYLPWPLKSFIQVYR
jgi:hypothetical protein